MGCKRFTIQEPDSPDNGGNQDPDNGDDSGDDSDSGDGGDGNVGQSNIGTPTVTNIQAIQNQALITFELSNTGDKAGSKEIKGLLDLGKTGQADKVKSKTIQVDAKDTVYESFEFTPSNSQDVEAKICVKEA
jgi:hypothetical protein